MGGESCIMARLERVRKEEYLGQPMMFEGLAVGICIKGGARIKIDYRGLDITANDMFAVMPGHIFSMEESFPEMEISIFLFMPEYMQKLPLVSDMEWIKKVESHPCISIGKDRMEELVALESMAVKYNSAGSVSCMDIRRSVLTSVLMITKHCYETFVGECRVANPSRQEKITRDFFRFLSENFRKERRVSYYADRLCITPKYLSAVVKEVTGNTVQEWISLAVIAEAKRFMRSTDLSVQYVSEEMNFRTSSSFVRFFRQCTGCTPLQYRKG